MVVWLTVGYGMNKYLSQRATTLHGKTKSWSLFLLTSSHSRTYITAIAHFFLQIVQLTSIHSYSMKLPVTIPSWNQTRPVAMTMWAVKWFAPWYITIQGWGRWLTGVWGIFRVIQGVFGVTHQTTQKSEEWRKIADRSAMTWAFSVMTFVLLQYMRHC